MFQIHQSRDTLDMSVDGTGGAGGRIACCTIEELVTENMDNAASSYTYGHLWTLVASLVAYAILFKAFMP